MRVLCPTIKWLKYAQTLKLRVEIFLSPSFFQILPKFCTVSLHMKTVDAVVVGAGVHDKLRQIELRRDATAHLICNR